MPTTRSQHRTRLPSPWKSPVSDKLRSPVKKSKNSNKKPPIVTDPCVSVAPIMASSSSDHSSKLPDLVFKGVRYGAWRQRIRNILIREGFLDLLSASQKETEFIQDQDRETKKSGNVTSPRKSERFYLR